MTARKRTAPPAGTDGTAIELPIRSAIGYLKELPQTLLEWALVYAGQGLPVLPLYAAIDGGCDCRHGRQCSSPGKHPRLRNGSRGASMDRQRVEEWWQAWPEANVGIATGATSGLFVVDIDPRHQGDESLSALEDQHGELPLTYTVRTGSGGSHLYFSGRGIDPPIRNSQARLGSGLDIRGVGGYVVAPPSATPAGNYRVKQRAPLAVPPAWLTDLLRMDEVAPGKQSRQRSPRSQPSSNSKIHPDRPVTRPPATNVDEAVICLISTSEGTRNETLNRLAFWAGKRAARGQLDLADFVCRLSAAARIAGLDDDEIDRTVWSGLSAGMRQI